MKGAKRLLSVFLLLVMLCTFFVFPADAATLDFSNPHTWEFGSTVNIDDLSNSFRLHSSLPSGLFAYITNLEPGSNYTLVFDMAFYYLGSNSSVSVFVQNSSDGSSLDLFDQNISAQGVVYKHKVDFKVPDNFVNPRLVVLVLNAQQMIFYKSNSLADNSTDKGILNSIKEGFSKLWEWLQGIWDSIKEIPTKIGQFITNLGDRISTFFSNLTNSIKGFFDNLWDKIWNGDGSVPPFDNNNKFAQVIEKLNEWTAKIKEFSGSIDSSSDTVTGYLQSGTSFLNSAMGAFPAALTAVLGFALVFIVVRKVVGR